MECSQNNNTKLDISNLIETDFKLIMEPLMSFSKQAKLISIDSAYHNGNLNAREIGGYTGVFLSYLHSKGLSPDKSIEEHLLFDKDKNLIRATNLDLLNRGKFTDDCHKGAHFLVNCIEKVNGVENKEMGKLEALGTFQNIYSKMYDKRIMNHALDRLKINLH